MCTVRFRMVFPIFRTVMILWHSHRVRESEKERWISGDRFMCEHLWPKILVVRTTHSFAHSLSQSVYRWRCSANGMKYDFEICINERKFSYENIESHPFFDTTTQFCNGLNKHLNFCVRVWNERSSQRIALRSTDTHTRA